MARDRSSPGCTPHHTMPNSRHNKMIQQDENLQSITTTSTTVTKPPHNNNDCTIPDNTKYIESQPVTVSQVKWMIDAAITKHQASPQTSPTELSLPELVSVKVKSQISDLTSSIAATAANQPRIIADQMKNMMHGSDYFKQQSKRN
jgi:hypothetical protein